MRHVADDTELGDAPGGRSPQTDHVGEWVSVLQSLLTNEGTTTHQRAKLEELVRYLRNDRLRIRMALNA